MFKAIELFETKFCSKIVPEGNQFLRELTFTDYMFKIFLRKKWELILKGFCGFI